jgi:predicted lipid-binding transport protein (Tim44 family)
MTSSRNSWHKRFVGAACALVVLLGFALVMQDAEARRLGGGKSFGRQSQNVTRQSAAPQSPNQGTAANPSQPPSAPQPGGNRWMGPLAGLAAGVGIAALLSHFGVMGPAASAIGGILVLALLLFGAFALWRFFLARNRAGTQRDPTSTFGSPLRTALEGPTGSGASTNAYGAPLRGTTGSSLSAPVWNVPAGFDSAEFLRSAKVYFTRLQAAWDAKDFDDIRRFTTPEVFAEIKMQNDEALGKADRTDIEQLDASLLGIETTADEYVASVRFTGSLREDGGNSQAFEEIWNLSKPTDGRTGWLLAGIQQIH